MAVPLVQPSLPPRSAVILSTVLVCAANHSATVKVGLVVPSRVAVDAAQEGVTRLLARIRLPLKLPPEPVWLKV